MRKTTRAISIGAVLSVLASLFVAAPAQATPVVIINQCTSISCDRASGNYYSTPAYSLAPGSVTVRIGEIVSYGGSTIINNPLKTEAGTQAESIEWRWRGQELNGTYPETYQSRINTCGTDVTGTYCSNQIHLDTITITGLNTDKMVQVQFRLIRNDEPTAWFADVFSVSLRHIEARVRDFTPTASISHSVYGANPIFVLANETFSISALNSLPNDDTFDLSQSTFAWNMYHGLPFTSLTFGTGTKSHSYNATGSYTIQLRVRNSMGVDDLETRTVYVSEPPTSSTPSLGLESGIQYTSRPSETLSIVWPRYASSMILDDDVNPFNFSSVASSPAWDFGWTATSGETRAVTVTFYDGSGAQVGSVLSQTVTYDIDTPLLSSATATRTDGALAFSLAATDQHSGISKVEISNGSTTVEHSYATAIASTLSGSNFTVRVKDLAGNWSASQSIVATIVNTAPSAPANNPPANNAPAADSGPAPSVVTVVTPVVTTPRVATKSKTSGASIASQAGVSISPGAKVVLSVSKASKKICKVSGGKLVALAPGNCQVTVSVTPKKTKVLKKPKTVKTPTTVVVG
jgi:hypothetical protein